MSDLEADHQSYASDGDSGDEGRGQGNSDKGKGKEDKDKKRAGISRVSRACVSSCTQMHSTSLMIRRADR